MSEVFPKKLMPKKYAIGIDLGGTYLRAALVSDEGEVSHKIKKPSSDGVIEALGESIAELGAAGAAGIGIGIAGLVDRKKGRVSVSPNMRAVEGIEIVKEVRDRFGVRVIIENDANAAALGERSRGAGREFENFVLLWFHQRGMVPERMAWRLPYLWKLMGQCEIFHLQGLRNSLQLYYP